MSHFLVAAATNKQKSAAKDTAKLDRETEELRREYRYDSTDKLH